MRQLTRRQLVCSTAACAGLAACGGPSAGTDSQVDTGGCATPSAGTDPPYCLVSASVVRVTGAVTLSVGQAVLANVDDDTAVIVARDAGGLHALSAICTHACCIVALCRDASCASLTPTPAACGATDVATADAEGEGVICPCHGSAFRLSDGVALSGPATAPLPSYAVTLDGQDVLVDTGTTVDPAWRS